MLYQKLCQIYEQLEATPKGLEKTQIIADFLDQIKSEPQTIYLLQGRVFPDYDPKEFGISHQLIIKAISKASGIPEPEVVENFKELGDLGKVAEKVLGKKKKQSTLFSEKLTVKKITENLQKLPLQEGKGAVEQKLNLILELLNSADNIEAKYITRTVLQDLKIGVGNGIIRDAIAEKCFQPKNIEDKKVCTKAVQEAYDKSTDLAEVFCHAHSDTLEKIKLKPGKPVKVMLFPKAKNVEDAFKIVGSPAAFEYKYDGFRVMVNKDENEEIKIFTRRLEEVTTQFPEIIEYVKKNIKGKTFILDCEAVGFDAKTKKYTDFQAISQRIKRKHKIEEMQKKLPIELVIFDIIYYEGKSLIDKPFIERRNLIEKIIIEEEFKIVLSKQIITENKEEVEKFYISALEDDQEGLMGKSLSAPYKPGARVGYAVKLKPEDKDFDLVITGAEWGTGKRAGWLTSFDVSCKDENENLLEVGKVSTGLKEKKEMGLSYEEMTDMLEKLVTEVDGRKIKVKPEIVVAVQYQNIQKSPSYTSGFALRFPRILKLREDRSVSDITTLNEIANEETKSVAL